MTHDVVNGEHMSEGRVADGQLAASGTTYEPPRLHDLGTIADLTRGSNPMSTDGLAPGSAL